MRKSLLLLALLALFVPSVSLAQNYKTLAASQLAVTTMSASEVTNKVPRNQCTVCKGTGKVKAGDTVVVVERECTNCYVSAQEAVKAISGAAQFELDPNILESVKAEKVEALVYTATWCKPCGPYKSNLSKLSTDDYNIRYIDYDTSTDRRGVNVVPTTIFMVGGTEVSRKAGSLTPNQFVGLYDTAAKGDPNAPTFFRIRFGKVDNIKPHLDTLKETLALLGPSGSIDIRPDTPGKPIVKNIVTGVRFEISAPVKITYKIVDDNVTLNFSPPPKISTVISGGLESMEITTDKINLKLKGLPDGFIEVGS